MVKTTAAFPLATLALDRNAAENLGTQLYFALRGAILNGTLRAGMRLPASRTLARDLAISRNPVITAYEQLQAEGYIQGRVGAGSFVSAQLPERLLQAPSQTIATGRVRRPLRLSRRGAAMAGLRRQYATGLTAFAPGLPDLHTFPFDLWSRLLARHWRRPTSDMLFNADPAGYGPLREAIAGYLGASHAVRCHADQIFIVSGSQQAIDLIARLLIDPGDQVWLEEPGYLGTRGALLGAGATLVPVPVDHNGIDVAAGIRAAPRARLACVCPSHQYPLGVTMSLDRRLALLEWAHRAEAFILEDDYDSEYRYGGRPLTALQGLDTQARVIYVGTMSKVMFPGLRLGYLVLPEDLVDPVKALRAHIDGHPSTLAQAALADFIAGGHFASHIRRMRTLYEERQQVLVDEARPLAPHLTIAPADAGMHLVASLPTGADDTKISQRARAAGVILGPLSRFYQGQNRRQGLMLGYAGFSAGEIRAGVRKLAGIFTPP
ncbi:MAG: MocR-like pyridoxine biosynthesis transcription factor PdxR [Alphaproteobacteria bacterium]